MVTASFARASEASTRRQLESVSRISSWISSGSVFNLSTRKGIKPARSMSTAPTGGDREGTWVKCECIYSFYLLNRIKIHMVTHVRDGHCSQMDLSNASARQLSDVPTFPHYNISPKLFLLRKYIKYIYIGVCIYMCVYTHTYICQLISSLSNCSQQEQMLRGAEMSPFRANTLILHYHLCGGSRRLETVSFLTHFFVVILSWGNLNVELSSSQYLHYLQKEIASKVERSFAMSKCLICTISYPVLSEH